MADLRDLVALEGGHELPREPQFTRLRAANVLRCVTIWHELGEWSPLEWAGSLAGEVGELCNEVKKLKRHDEGRVGSGGDLTREERVRRIGHEMADVLTYLDLLAATLEIDLWQASVEKFNIVSARVGSTVRLEP